jgi:hypothetical protein
MATTRVPSLGPLAGHETRIRDLRSRFGDPEQFAAECSCGWRGEPRGGANGGRRARRDATEHVDRARSGAAHV